jgi:hypothetical protein
MSSGGIANRGESIAIPAWSAEGILPPINTSHPTSLDRSPYAVAVTDLVLRFGHTPERRTVLDGFLRYRGALHAAGLTRGFQWLDGSFLEHVELLESRAPNDIDVVTFYRLPAGMSQKELAALAPDVFPTSAPARRELRASHCVDAYVVDLGMAPERLAQHSAYWYSVWSHRRDHAWKGFVQLDLTPAGDAAAAAILASLDSQEAQP